MSDFESKIINHFKDGSIKPIIDFVFDLEQIADAHRTMESNTTIGKILLKVHDDESDQNKPHQEL
jgi:tumor protein p53-inducible protein 3